MQTLLPPFGLNIQKGYGRKYATASMKTIHRYKIKHISQIEILRVAISYEHPLADIVLKIQSFPYLTAYVVC
jgi:hypothetical protein